LKTTVYINSYMDYCRVVNETYDDDTETLESRDRGIGVTVSRWDRDVQKNDETVTATWTSGIVPLLSIHQSSMLMPATSVIQPCFHHCQLIGWIRSVCAHTNITFQGYINRACTR